MKKLLALAAIAAGGVYAYQRWLARDDEDVWAEVTDESTSVGSA